MAPPPNDDTPQAQPPLEEAPPKLTAPKQVAGGAAAVRSALRHAQAQMGSVRGLKTLARMNQFDGFDCPGCAWPDADDHRSRAAEYCENGAKAIAEEATVKRVDASFFAAHSVKHLATQSDYWLSQQGRLTSPMVLEPGATHYTPISWDDAFGTIAEHLNGLSNPDEAIFYTSGRTSNEAAFLYQLFVRQYGTNNLPDCSNMCHESSGTGLGEAIGIGKGTVTLGDFEKSDLIFVIGQNPGTNHPRMLLALQGAKRAGARIVHVNPLPEAGLIKFKNPQEVGGWLGGGTALADLFLQVRINGDVALLKGIMKALIEAEDREPGAGVNGAFIDAKTEGFSAFADDLRQTRWSEITERSGLDEQSIRGAAALAMETDRIIICWAMGLTQHHNGVANVQSCANLLLMRGAIGHEGAGACPVRGHSNVQGDRTMGIWEKPKPAFLDALGAHFDFEPPRHHGVDAVNAIKAMHRGDGKVFFAMGGNFLSATPDTEYTADALRRCDLTVQVSTKLNRSHLVTGKRAIILPCLGRTERDVQPSGVQFVSVENSMGVVHQSNGTLPPASDDLLSEPRLVARLAEATLGDRSSVPWSTLADDYDRIRAAIEAVIPGFDDYNVRVRARGGFYLPNGPRHGEFSTENSKAKFTVHPIPVHLLEEDELMMMTVRSHDQYNTTIYGLDDRYRGVLGGRRVVFMHRDDMAARGLSAGDAVDLTSTYEDGVRRVEAFYAVPYDIPRRCVATYFPEANPLVPIHQVARRSNTPASKQIRVRVHPRRPA
ncbi:MAG: FdhF/YdeP family oxidoreductase [Bradymonadia bacterium]